MSSAQLEPRPQLQDEDPGPAPSLFAVQDQSVLREQVAARIAAHRARRQRNTPAAPQPIPIASSPRARAARIAATVAERYARTESYRSFLAAEAENAVRQAEAAAEAARAVAAAQLTLLEELHAQLDSQLDTQFDHDLEVAHTPHTAAHPDKSSPARPHHSSKDHSAAQDLSQLPLLENNTSPEAPASARLTVRLYEDPAPVPTLPQSLTTSHQQLDPDPLDDEVLVLDDEIAFRQSPTFADPTPPVEIPANLLEFPRQLVAARRARPRIAEGPLREDFNPATEAPRAVSQLRIFEVEPAQISDAPAVADAAPEWTSIMLGAQPLVESTLVVPQELDVYPVVSQPLLQTAPLELRIMAAAVDSCIVLAAMLAFATAAVLTVDRLPLLELPPLSNPAALIGRLTSIGVIGAAAFLILTALYQLLFFTFSDSTPGMTYARIGLCTFTDENPTRDQMRRRVLAFLLSACPLGLGLFWSWIDTDRLGWHDRLSRMYQRSY